MVGYKIKPSFSISYLIFHPSPQWPVIENKVRTANEGYKMQYFYVKDIKYIICFHYCPPGKATSQRLARDGSATPDLKSKWNGIENKTSK